MATGRVPTTANSPLTAKGDLFTYSTAPARLAVGTNGDSLVADSAASSGLSYQANWAAGKNKIINGDFNINQRGFTSSTTSGTYGFDRWIFLNDGDGTATYSAQTFTPGTAPAAPYESTNFARLVTTGQTSTSVLTRLVQRIEDVRTFAGQTITISFYAKAATGTPKIAVEQRQDFGSGGSTGVNTYAGQVTLSTSWARYSVTVSLPSISGKTIGTSSASNINLYVSAGSDNNARTGSLGIQNNTFDIWGVQAETGSVATAFQTATGTIQGELAACRYYFERLLPNAAGNGYSGVGHYYTTTQCYTVQYWEQKRVTPTTTNSNASGFTANSAGVNRTSTATAADQITTWGMDYSITTSAVTLGASAIVGVTGGTYIDVSAEL